MPEIKHEKIQSEDKQSGIEITRERELKDLSKKALEIFEEKLASIPELEKPEKVGETIITKEADAIIYQVDWEKFNLKLREIPFEIGLGDPKDREEAYTHFKIVQEIEKKLKESIIDRIHGLLWLDENKEINLSLDTTVWNSFNEYLLNERSALRFFQEMSERYQIKKLWISGEEKSKEIFERMEKIIWDTQTSVYAKKQGMTNTEFLRWRLSGGKSEEDEKEKNQ